MKPATLQSYRERILRAVQYLEANLDKEVSLERLADEARFSPHHFHRIFSGMVGESVAAHVRRLKLQRAASLLIATDKSVLDLALEAGYESHEAFTRAFKALFHTTPSRFRRERGYGPHTTGDRLLALMDRTFNQKGEDMDATVENFEPLRVAFVRHTGPYQECEKAWKALCAWAGPKNLFGPDTRFVGVSHDDPEVTEPAKIRYDACITVAEDVEPQGEVGVKTLPGGLYAVHLHKGPYTGLAQAYAQLCGRWAPENGYELLAEPSMEFYLNDPDTTQPQDLQTQISVAVRKA